MEKNRHNNIKNAYKDKDRRPEGRLAPLYKYNLLFNTRKLTQQIVDDLCSDLIDWAKRPTSLTIRAFMKERKINESTYYAWTNRYPAFKEAHEFALMAVGDNRENKATDYCPNNVYKTQAAYCPTYKHEEERRAMMHNKMNNYSPDEMNALVKQQLDDISREIDGNL